MKIFAAGLLVAASVALAVTTANGGAAESAAHLALSAVPHHGTAHRVAAPRRAAGFTCGSSCSSYQAAIDKFFTDVAAASGTATNVYGVATQYCQGVPTSPPSGSCGGTPTPIAYTSTFGGSYVDGRPFPANACNDAVTIKGVRFADKYCLTNGQLQTELEKAIAANSWPTDSTKLFFLFTPNNVGICHFSGPASDLNDCSTNAFCAYHTATPSKIIYAVAPDAAEIPDAGCDTGQSPVGSGADATISGVSHEHNEAITDPFLDGWAAADGSENGDLCAFNFGTPLGTALNGQSYNQVINGTDYWLQQEYSNTDGGCLQQPGGTVSPITQQDGVGPLVYDGGSVMLTNTVYAIYWFPAAPANTVLPTITGTAKVGKKLKASHGTWSNVPTYTYRWLRCSSTGTSCKGISMATRSSYTLVKADARHRLEVRVTATNTVGSLTATSAPTGTVTTSRRAHSVARRS